MSRNSSKQNMIPSHVLTPEEIYSFHKLFESIAISFGLGNVEGDEITHKLAKKVSQKKLFYDCKQGSLENYLGTIAKNLARDIHRAQNAKRCIQLVSVEDIGIYNEIGVDYNEVEELSAKREEQLKWICRARKAVEKKAKSPLATLAFAYIYDNGYSRVQTAKLLGKDPSYIDSTISHRLTAIKKWLKRHGA